MTLTLNLDANTHTRLSSYSRKKKMSEANAVQILLQMALDRELLTEHTPVSSTPRQHKKIIVSPLVKSLSNVPSVQDNTDYKESFATMTEEKYM